MLLYRLTTVVAGILILPALAQNVSAPVYNKPATPFHASSRWIMDANGQRIKLRCINWAGHMEANLPEGLHKQSLEYLVDWIANQGFNCVRLTYAVDLVKNANLTVKESFTAAASPAGVSTKDMLGLYAQAVQKNPFLASATILNVYGKVIDLLWARGLFTILDNHVSKASWCCDLADGNGWWKDAFGYNDWNSRYFDTAEWLNALQYMATWSRKNHPGVQAMSLRNEMRAFLLQGANGPQDDWYDRVGRAARAVHAAHPDLLVLVGGVQSATDFLHIRTRKMLDATGWREKLVWEWHAYSFTVTFPDVFSSCDVVKSQYGLFAGFLLEQGKEYTAPLVLSEFGVGMSGGKAENHYIGDKDWSYLKCMVDYSIGNDQDWIVWAIQGSYYVRDKTVDKDETWGMMDKEWKGWRNPDFPGLLGAMWNMTQKP